MRLRARRHGSHDEDDKRAYRRFSAETTAKLINVFMECPHPDENRQRRLSKELGLDYHQVKFWFQNKRTYYKTQIERSDNGALRRENRTMRLENHILKETLRNVQCQSCGGSELGSQEREHSCHKMKMENVLLSQELERLRRFLSSIPGMNIPRELQATSSTSSSYGTCSRESTTTTAVYSKMGGSSGPYQRIPILDQTFTPQIVPAPNHQPIPILNQKHMPHILYQDTNCLSPHAPNPNPTPSTLHHLYQQHNSSILDHHLPPFITSHDYSVPSLITALDQVYISPSVVMQAPNLGTVTPSLDQNMNMNNHGAATHSLDQNMNMNNHGAVTPSLDQNMNMNNYGAVTPSFVQDMNLNNVGAVTPSLDQNLNMDMNNIHGAATPSLDQDMIMNALDTTPNDLQDLDLDALLQILNDDSYIPQPVTNSSSDDDIDKSLVKETAENAAEELMRLLSMNAPFWFRSLIDGKFILQRESYYKLFPRNNHLSGTHAHFQSSKDSRVVNMKGTQLVEMFLNSDKWMDLFPTIVKRAETIQVFDSGSLETRNGAFKLMRAEMHILSPLVPTREFLFIRYCKEIESGVWLIADVSLDPSKLKNTVPNANWNAWKLPSGCLIQEMTEGMCRVSWVEHVEVDDKVQTHELFRDLICGDNAYGAERWVSTLERMCERFASASARVIPNSDIGGAVGTLEGRRNVMELSHRMVKDFCASLDMRDNIDLTSFNNNGVRVCARIYTDPTALQGLIISAAISFWLPFSPYDLFYFLNDYNRRSQWDLLCYENPVHEIQHISNGGNPNNCISMILPSMQHVNNNMVILQETHADDLGCMIVFAPFDQELIEVAINGVDTSSVPVLSSGFTISSDGQSNAVEGRPRGSLVTLLHQILTFSSSANGSVDLESVGVISTLVSSTVDKIKVALQC